MKTNNSLPITFLLVLLLSLFSISSTHAQFFKRLKNRAKEAAERTIERKVEEKTERATESAIDSLFAIKLKKKRDSTRVVNQGGMYDPNINYADPTNGYPPSQEDIEYYNEIGYEETEHIEKESLNYSSDFEAGAEVVFKENFLNDALNDFPISWNTTGSGVIVTFGNDPSKWLRMEANSSFMPEAINSIPANATIEFDLKADDNYSWLKNGIDIVITSFDEEDDGFYKFYEYSHKKNGVIIRMDPIAHTETGSLSITKFKNGKEVFSNDKFTERFNKSNRSVRVAIWKQDTRLRLYLDGQKIWDLPRAFDKNMNYNALLFGTATGTEDDVFYIRDLTLADAKPDTRHTLLEEGRFETNEILFEVNEATLMDGSYVILDDLGKALSEEKEIQILIIGHTDGDGEETFNQELSERRAKEVKKFLVDNFKIEASHLICSGKGEKQPIAPNNTEEGKAMNRRVEFIKL